MTECEICRKGFEAKPGKRFCSDLCRKRAWKQGQRLGDDPRTLGTANRDVLDELAERLGTGGFVDEIARSHLTAAQQLADEVDRDPSNAMLWMRYQASLRDLEKAVDRVGNVSEHFDQFIEHIRRSAKSEGLAEWVLGHKLNLAWIDSESVAILEAAADRAVSATPDAIRVHAEALRELDPYTLHIHPEREGVLTVAANWIPVAEFEVWDLAVGEVVAAAIANEAWKWDARNTDYPNRRLDGKPVLVSE